VARVHTLASLVIDAGGRLQPPSCCAPSLPQPVLQRPTRSLAGAGSLLSDPGCLRGARTGADLTPACTTPMPAFNVFSSTRRIWTTCLTTMRRTSVPDDASRTQRLGIRNDSKLESEDCVAPADACWRCALTKHCGHSCARAGGCAPASAEPRSRCGPNAGYNTCSRWRAIFTRGGTAARRLDAYLCTGSFARVRVCPDECTAGADVIGP